MTPLGQAWKVALWVVLLEAVPVLAAAAYLRWFRLLALLVLPVVVGITLGCLWGLVRRIEASIAVRKQDSLSVPGFNRRDVVLLSIGVYVSGFLTLAAFAIWGGLVGATPGTLATWLLAGLPLGVVAACLFRIRNPSRSWLAIAVGIGFAILADGIWALIVLVAMGAAISAV